MRAPNERVRPRPSDKTGFCPKSSRSQGSQLVKVSLSIACGWFGKGRREEGYILVLDDGWLTSWLEFSKSIADESSRLPSVAGPLQRGECSRERGERGEHAA